MNGSARGWRAACALVAGALLGSACSNESGTADVVLPEIVPTSPPGPATDRGAINPRLLRRFQSITAVAPTHPERVALGRRLFEDPRLSADGKVSCASCHPLDRYGADGQPVSIGVRGTHGRRNAPTVFNAVFQTQLMWDGRAATLEEQASMPLVAGGEMAMATMEAVVSSVARDPSYVAAFTEAFPGAAHAVTRDNVVAAIAEFERTLVTPARWDRYLDGDREALTPPEVDGLRAFLDAGCMVCHTGRNLGGMTLERAGVIVPWPNQEDQGRAEITHQAADRMVFRVPSLRNVAETAPYFHDGSVAELEDAVVVMGRHQLGLELTSTEAASIATWLRSLTGTLPTQASPPMATSADATPAEAPRCGLPGRPPCPLQGWMRGSARPAMQHARFDELETVLAQVGGFAPPGFGGWSELASQGRAAALQRDLDGVRVACEGCHSSFRERYRREARERALP